MPRDSGVPRSLAPESLTSSRELSFDSKGEKHYGRNLQCLITICAQRQRSFHFSFLVALPGIRGRTGSSLNPVLFE